MHPVYCQVVQPPREHFEEVRRDQTHGSTGTLLMNLLNESKDSNEACLISASRESR